MTKLLVASTNPGKIREYGELLNEMGLDWGTPQDFGFPSLDVPETGDTYAENATLKALAYWREFGRVTLADDSGLEVDALGGAPGLYSARYGGYGATDADRRRLLLHNLRDMPPPRTARFRCVIAVTDLAGRVRTAEGICPGEIGFEERGTQGFGYDPLFVLKEYDKTMAEIDPEIKNRVSHRGRALRAAVPLILEAVRGIGK